MLIQHVQVGRLHRHQKPQAFCNQFQEQAHTCHTFTSCYDTSENLIIQPISGTTEVAHGFS